VAKTSHESNYDIDAKIKAKMSNIMKWIGFYREHIDIFIEDYLGIKLKLFQKIILVMIEYNLYFLFLAARGIGKSFLIAIYCCARCILYPGTKIVIASGSRQQANLVLEKIVGGEILGSSQNLGREIKDWRITSQESYIKFYNRSSIEVVASNDFARGRRSNVLIVDEFRLVDKETIRDILQPFNAVPRQPKYLSDPKYSHLVESNKEIYMSSAWFKTHWSFDFFQMYVNAFLSRQDYFVCALPYQLAIAEGIADKRDLENKIQEEGFSYSSWEMERECIFLGADDNAFYSYEDLDKIRTLEFPIYTRDIYNIIDDKKIKYPLKKHGEIRILSVDVAIMGGKKNDNTAAFVMQLEPFGSDKYKQYRRNVVYGETYEGGHHKTQTIQIRRLFDDFECDYLVLDCTTPGMGIYDDLVTEIFDKERIITYPALTCMNDEDMAKRCVVLGAKKVIYSIKGNANFNSDCAIWLRDDIKQGKLRLLLNTDDGERLLKSLKWYNSIDLSTQAKMLLPYVQTHLLIDEMVNLESDIKDNTVKLKEQSTRRKDRYSSISYANYFAKSLERNIVKKPDPFVASMVMSRKPVIR
jgi:hypothetical protein